MRREQINEEVIYARDQIVKVNQQVIAELKEKSTRNIRERIRLCAHKDTNDKVHEMLIVHARDTFVRPHKHPDKSESFHIIEGAADVVVFNDPGDVIEVVQMSDYLSDRCFFCRISDPLYHTLQITSDIVVFHESTNGPFVRSDTVFPKWAPEEEDENAVKLFMKRLSEKVETFLSQGK